MHIYTLCPSLLQSFMKFCWAVSEELLWQETQDWRTDWLTDGRVKNIMPSATSCLGYNKALLTTRSKFFSSSHVLSTHFLNHCFDHLIASYTGFFCLFRVLRPTQFTYIETSPFKFRPKLGPYGYWAVRVFFQHVTLTVTRANYLWWLYSSTGNTHTCCRAFGSGTVTNAGQLGTRQTRHLSNSAPVDQIRHLSNSAPVKLGTC